MNRRILILGSGGQIGAYLTDYLNKIGYEVLEFDVVNGLHQDMTEIPNPELHRQIMRSHFVFFLAFDAGGSHSNSHTGTVTSHSENIRSTDFSARYSIDVECTQNSPAEGLARFTQMLASTMEPVDTQATS